MVKEKKFLISIRVDSEVLAALKSARIFNRSKFFRRAAMEAYALAEKNGTLWLPPPVVEPQVEPERIAELSSVSVSSPVVEDSLIEPIPIVEVVPVVESVPIPIAMSAPVPVETPVVVESVPPPVVPSDDELELRRKAMGDWL